MYTYKELMYLYRNYSNSKTKIQREIKNNKIIKIYKDAYVDDRNYPKFAVGCELISPSYVSFYSVLCMNSMVEDMTMVCTLATTGLRKHKTLRTSVGNFIYRDIPIKVFMEEINYAQENGVTYLIATKEKALCDTLYSFYRGIKSIKQLMTVLIEDMRFDMRTLYSLDAKKLLNLCPLYKSTTLKTLMKFIKREVRHGRFASND